MQAPWSRRIERLEADNQRLQQRLTKAERAIGKAERGEWKDTTPLLVELDYPRAEIRLEAPTKLSRKRRNATKKEPFTVEWIESLPAGSVVYDIGANVGAYALIAAKRPQGALRVLAFEPGFANYALLCRNVMHNDAGGAVTPLPVTLGEQTTLGRFAYSDVQAGAALHAGGIEAQGQCAWSQPVLVYALEELVERFGLPAPEHVKLDVDGAELAVLRGAGALLGRAELRSVMIELSREQRDEVERLLVAHGLERSAVYGERAGQDGRFEYALFERR